MVPADLTASRARALTYLADSCTITRPVATRDRTVDPVTLALVPAAAGAVYTGVCCYFPGGGGHREQGGGTLDVEPGKLLLPYATDDVARGDSVTITASGDEDLVGVVLRVTEVLVKTFGVYRHCLVEQVTSTPRQP